MRIGNVVVADVYYDVQTQVEDVAGGVVQITYRLRDSLFGRFRFGIERRVGPSLKPDLIIQLSFHDARR